MRALSEVGEAELLAVDDVRFRRRNVERRRDEAEVGEGPVRRLPLVADLDAVGRPDLAGEPVQSPFVLRERGDDDLGLQLAGLGERESAMGPAGVGRVGHLEVVGEVRRARPDALQVLPCHPIAVPLALVLPDAVAEPVHPRREVERPTEAVLEQDAQALGEVGMMEIDEDSHAATATRTPRKLIHCWPTVATSNSSIARLRVHAEA